MRFLTVFFVACLVASPVSAYGWDEPARGAVDPWPNFEEDYDVWAPTARDRSNRWQDYAPDGAAFQREYENQQYRSRYGGCANMYDNNPAAKEACLQGLGR